MQQATVSIGSRTPNRMPYSSILLTLGGRGSLARWRPSRVRVSVSGDRAPISSKSCTAFLMLGVGGASIALDRKSCRRTEPKSFPSKSLTCSMQSPWVWLFEQHGENGIRTSGCIAFFFIVHSVKEISSPHGRRYCHWLFGQCSGIKNSHLLYCLFPWADCRSTEQSVNLADHSECYDLLEMLSLPITL